MKRPIHYLLALCLITPGLILGDSQKRSAPADPVLEPLLTGGRVLFLQGGDLLALGGAGDGPIPVRALGGKQRRIVRPAAVAAEQLTVAWIEQSAEGNHLYLSSAGADGTFPKNPEPLATGRSTFVQLIQAPATTPYLLDGAGQGEPALFLGHSEPGGRGFLRKPLPLDGFQSVQRVSAVAIGSHLHIFVHGLLEGRGVIALLDYDSGTRQTAPAQIVAEVSSTPLLQALALKGEPAVIYKAFRGGSFSLNLARHQPGGWNSHAIAAADGMDVARLDHHVWPDGRTLIVFSGELPHRSKQRVFAALSQDGGESWHSTRLDGAQFPNSRAWLPRLAVEGERVAVVWEDGRDIRSRIRLQLSSDRGATWQAQDAPLSPGDRYAMRPRIGSTGGELQIVWMQYRSDAHEQINVVLRTLPWDEALALANRELPEIDPRERAQQLHRAASSYWQAMIQDDRQAAYLAHDPFYRAHIPFIQYAARRGPILYHRYQVEEIAIRGNEATVAVKVNYSVPRLKSMGKEHSLAARDFLVRDTWLFIDDAWRRKFVDPLSGGSAIEY